MFKILLLRYRYTKYSILRFALTYNAKLVKQTNKPQNEINYEDKNQGVGGVQTRNICIATHPTSQLDGKKKKWIGETKRCEENRFERREYEKDVRLISRSCRVVRFSTENNNIITQDVHVLNNIVTTY